MKTQKFNSQELGLISMSYMKGLFPKPKSGELLNDEGSGDGSFTFYYEENYFAKYCSAIKEAFNSGAFARSNSESDWNNLMAKILSATETEHADEITLSNYWLTES